jgi:hypothetical protein
MNRSKEKMCMEWDLNRMVNPRTGRKLQKQTSKIYQSLKKECEPIIQVQREKKKSEKKKKEDVMLVYPTTFMNFSLFRYQKPKINL